MTTNLGTYDLINPEYEIVMLRPNPEGFICIDWKGREGGGMEGRNRYLASICTEARAASRTRTFMASEYGSTSRKDAMPFSTSSAIVGPNSS